LVAVLVAVGYCRRSKIYMSRFQHDWDSSGLSFSYSFNSDELQSRGLVNKQEHSVRTLVPRQEMTGADRSWMQK
jgi:hypothetical protein